MDDKTLLERAARAASIYYWLEDDVLLTHGDDGPGSFRQWNPLTDSGQALELAVALEMDIGQMVTEGCVTVQDDRLQRCAACGEVFDLDDHAEEDDDEMP